MILCCHEEIAVAVAHGYAKATGKIMPAIVHNVVGLQHASMAIYNAWCDRTPILVMGGTGPMNTSKRRPWIDWIHTALVQGNLVRDFVAVLSSLDNQLAETGDSIIRDRRSINSSGQIVRCRHLKKFTRCRSQRRLWPASIRGARDSLESAAGDPRAAAFIAGNRSPTAGVGALALSIHSDSDRSRSRAPATTAPAAGDG